MSRKHHHPGRAGHSFIPGQRQRLPQPRLRCPGRRARHPPHPHPPLPAPDKRQSRSIHPHPPTRMGIRTRLHLVNPPRQSPPRLDQVVQQPPTTRRARRPPTTKPRLTRCEVLQLICRCVCQVGHGGGVRVCGFLVGMGGGVSALGLSRRAVEADMRGFGYPHDRVCVGSWPHL